MTITDEQLKGNWGEQYIAANLSASDCFVRHVTQGQDSGLDLYCEATINGEPILHFWCQVKTSIKWKGRRKVLSFNPNKKKDHIKYWISQPVPVFIFLVPDMRMEKFTPFYICKAIDFLPNRTKIESFMKIESPPDLNLFIIDHLPIEIFRWELMKGKVTFLKTTQGQYIKSIPQGLSQTYEPKLLDSLSNTLSQLCRDLMFQGDDPILLLEMKKKSKKDLSRFQFIKPYIESLEKLIYGKNDKHYHHYEALGFYYEIIRDFPNAIKHYERSLAILHSDPNTMNPDKPWDSVINRVNKHIERVRVKKKQLIKL